jgi:hypothetical protein
MYYEVLLLGQRTDANGENRSGLETIDMRVLAIQQI